MLLAMVFVEPPARVQTFVEVLIMDVAADLV